MPQNLTIQETVDKIHELGGIASAAHPFGSYVFRTCAGMKSVIADALEVYNSTLTGRQNGKALKIAKAFKKSVTAGSDSHTWREVGNAGLILEGDPIEAILKGNVKVFGKNISLFDLSYRTTKKFIRSAKRRISNRR